MGYLVNRCVRPGVPVQSALGEPDPLYADVLSYLRFNEADGATSITDEKGLSWTVQSLADITSAVSVFGNSLECRYDGSSSFANMDCAFASLGAQDFSAEHLCIEFWFRPHTDNSSNPLFHLGDRGSDYLQASVTPGFGSITLEATGGFSTQTLTRSITAFTWYHFALTKTGAGAWVVYINGMSIGSGTGLTWNGNETLHYGYNRTSLPIHQSFDGNFDEARVTLSATQRYTGNFTPQSAEHPNFGP